MDEATSLGATTESFAEPAPASVAECLARADPLDDAVVDFLLAYREEDGLVDFKRNFGFEEREWLGVTKDAIAFSNTAGGYLVFGVRNQSFEVEGLSTTVALALSNTDEVRKKLSRFVDPSFESTRTKAFNRAGCEVVVWHIPESHAHIHVIKNDASFRYPSGEEKTVLRRGTVWVRGSAGNRLADSWALDAIFEKRMTRARRRLLVDIARVVEAPAEAKVVLVGEGLGEPTEAVIGNSPDAVEVKSMSFTVPPGSLEEEVAGRISMARADGDVLPPVERVWVWYAERRNAQFTKVQRTALARWSLLTGVPAFYWLQDATTQELRTVVLDATKHVGAAMHLSNIIGTAAFLGSRFHKSVLKRLSKHDGRIPPRFKSVPCSSPKSLMRAAAVEGSVGTKNPTMSTAAMVSELDRIAALARDSRTTPGTLDRDRAIALDCLLYGRHDGYPRDRPETRH